MSLRPTLLAALLLSALGSAHAKIELIAIGQLSQAVDLSGLSGSLENGKAAASLGGIGSGLAWAGGSTFLALPDRGPNATAWNSAVDDTTSYIARYHSLTLELTHSASGSLPYTLTPTLNQTTLLYSASALNYGPVTPSANSAGKFYFDGRSDNFAAGSSTNPNNARLDPEGIRVSTDRKSVFVSDEYGPYVYQFDRATGERIRSFALPANLAISTLSAKGDAEIAGNSVGRIANKGMEGLAITPDGKTLYGFMQSPLAQDSKAGKPGSGDVNRIVQIDIASGAVKEFAYNNLVGGSSFNSSEMLALNDHQFLVLERDGKGLGDGSKAAFKQLRLVDLSGAADVTALSGEAALKPLAASSSLFLDIRAVLNANGIADTDIPAKLEGISFGDDIVDGGTTYHTLYLANDNDFVPDVAGSNKFFVFRFSDADLRALGVDGFVPEAFVPEPGSLALTLAGLMVAGWISRRRRAA
ncbi:MAG: esterase-like activity of phytase family protein [Burkholderiales bacterium]|nr:esterase-like activity of phytase family protein [Burkholderiales bacterium]